VKRTSRLTRWLLFPFALALLSWVSNRRQTLADEPWAWSDSYPKVTLKTQDNKEVRFYEDLIKGKLVLINFMYTSCEGDL
jgi:protein SCO1/2